MVLPGRYEVRLTVDGQVYRQPITVKLDPRVPYSTQELQRQLDLGQEITARMNATYRGYNQAAQLHSEVADRVANLKQSGKSPEALAAAQTLEGKARELTDAAGPPAGMGPLNRDLTRLLVAVDQADTPPASALTEAFTGLCEDTHAALARWIDLRSKDLEQLNALLAKESMPAIRMQDPPPGNPNCPK
jgi:hypothetical protein